MDLNTAFATTIANEPRATLRTWGICGLLLLATMIMYMDRQALAQQKTEITASLHLNNKDYGRLELGFGLAFAVGGIVTGFLADRISPRWFYPIVLLGWSSVGFATGWVTSYWQLFACRVFLGFFEAGHWPCALVTVAAPALAPRPGAGQQHPPERRVAGRDRDADRRPAPGRHRAGELANPVPRHRGGGGLLGRRLARDDPRGRPGVQAGGRARTGPDDESTASIDAWGPTRADRILARPPVPGAGDRRDRDQLVLAVPPRLDAGDAPRAIRLWAARRPVFLHRLLRRRGRRLPLGGFPGPLAGGPGPFGPRGADVGLRLLHAAHRDEHAGRRPARVVDAAGHAARGRLRLARPVPDVLRLHPGAVGATAWDGSPAR